MYDRFRLSFCPDRDYEDYIGEILYDDEFCILVSQDEGFESLDVEIHPRKDGQPWRFKMKELECALNRARQGLWERRRIPGKDSEIEKE
jgi:hypothetical protein